MTSKEDEESIWKELGEESYGYDNNRYYPNSPYKVICKKCKDMFGINPLWKGDLHCTNCGCYMGKVEKIVIEGTYNSKW